MKNRLFFASVVAAGLLIASASNAKAGFGCGACEPSCGAPVCCDPDPCCSPRRHCRGLLTALFNKCRLHRGSDSCCEPECGCEPERGCEPECGCEPACGCEADPCCGIKRRGGGLFRNLFKRHRQSCCEPACGCEPECGCEPSCGGGK